MASNQKTNWVKWIILVVVLGGATAGGLYYARKPDDSLPEFRTVTASRGDIVQQVTANGQISPVKNVTVGTQVSGIIKELFVDFNSRVTNNEVIARIDPSTYEQNLEQAQAELANAKAGLEYADLNYKRAKGLRDAALVSASEYDKAIVDLHQAEAVVRTREAAVKKSSVDLERTTIFAPIDGVVISRNVDVGQTVAASFNTPTLFNIANDLAKMQIEAMVSEADVGGVEEGQSVNFTVDAFPQRKFRGTIKQVRFAPTTNQNVVNYTTVVEVNNADLKLRPGMTANANIVISERKGALHVPNAALRFRPPQGSVIQGGTNAAAAAASTKVEIATSGPFTGLPVPPWQAKGERRRPTDEERAAYDASLTPEQKKQYQQVMAEMRSRFARSGGGPGEFDGAQRPRRSEPEGPRTQTVYVLDKDAAASGREKAVLKPVTVKLGITDGTNTEVIEGLKEGDVVVSGTVTQTAAAPTTPAGSPFGGGPFGGGPRIR